MAAVSSLLLVLVQFIPMLFYLTTAAACPSFTPPVEEGRAVCPGEELTYTCTIFDGTGSSATVWRMTCAGGGVVLVHSTLGDPPIECGPFLAQLTASDGDCYTSTLTVTALLELNGTVVICGDTSGNVGSATILLSKSTPSDYNFHVAVYHCSRSSLPHPHPHPKPLH